MPLYPCPPVPLPHACPLPCSPVSTRPASGSPFLYALLPISDAMLLVSRALLRLCSHGLASLGTQRWVWDVEFFSDASMLVSCASDNTARCWNLSSGMSMSMPVRPACMSDPSVYASVMEMCVLHACQTWQIRRQRQAFRHAPSHACPTTRPSSTASHKIRVAFFASERLRLAHHRCRLFLLQQH